MNQRLLRCAELLASLHPEDLPDAEANLIALKRELTSLPAGDAASLVSQLMLCRNLADSAHRFWERQSALAQLAAVRSCTDGASVSLKG